MRLQEKVHLKVRKMVALTPTLKPEPSYWEKALPPSLFFFKALKDNSISAFSFVFKITNISAFVYV